MYGHSDADRSGWNHRRSWFLENGWVKKVFFRGVLWLVSTLIFFRGGWEEMAAHRGLTHSLLFLPIIAPVMGEPGVSV